MRCMLAWCSLLMVFFLLSCERTYDDNNISAQDKIFPGRLAIANRAEIIMGNLALAKATDDSILDYARVMVTEHTAAEAELKMLAGNLYIAITADSLDTTGMIMRTTLTRLSGSAFDSAYIYGQAAEHKKTAAIVQTEIDGGTNSSLRNFATTMLSVIQLHKATADTIASRY